MTLTTKQEMGLKIILDRYHNKEKYTVIAGYAGTGKSTLVKFAIDALQVDPSRVAYATFTGKAAEVLRQMGNENAQTLHRLLYEHIPKMGGGFFRRAKQFLGCDIVVVDEISMVPDDMITLLFSHPVYVICLGDPFQLPPIDKDNANHLLDNPHVFLDEIMRQAAESEIIRLSMDIREQKPLNPYRGSDVQIIKNYEVVTGMLTWADQIIVATNATRQAYNTQVRTLLGHGADPEEGDKVICLRNYWDDITINEGNALVNGTIGYLENPTKTILTFPHVYNLQKHQTDIISTNVRVDNDKYEALRLDYSLIAGGPFSLDWRDTYLLGKAKLGSMVPKEFDYGYAITAHKAQGSQWGKILVIEERFPRESVEHARWLYTAVTRGINKVVLATNS